MIGTLLLIVANCAVLVGFYVYFRRRLDRALQSDEILKAVRDEVSQMIVDMNETADRNIALIEERIARLSSLVGDADRRIVVLQKEVERTKTRESVYSQLKPKPAVPAAPTMEEPVRAKSPREEVMELFHQGIDPKQIATKLNKTLGEVELIISLGDRRR